MKSGSSAFDLFQNVRSFCSPDKRLWLGVVLGDVMFDGVDEFGDVAEAAAPDLFLRQVSKESLDHVEP